MITILGTYFSFESRSGGRTRWKNFKIWHNKHWSNGQNWHLVGESYARNRLSSHCLPLVIWYTSAFQTVFNAFHTCCEYEQPWKISLLRHKNKFIRFLIMNKFSSNFEHIYKEIYINLFIYVYVQNC